MASKIPMTFQIFQGEELVRTEQLTQDIIKVGKLPSSHLRIDDDNVSRMHAVIEVTGPDEIFIIDLGSASGTIVNGAKVNKSKLANGDEILLGGTRVKVEIGQPIEIEDASKSAGVGGAAGVGAPAMPSVPAPNPFAAPAAGLANPFAAPVATAAAGGPVDPESVRYGVVASGPAVSASEVETDQQAVEVVIMWGDNSILSVQHLSPPRPYTVGDAADAKGKSATDYLIDGTLLGTSSLSVVALSGSGVAAVIPPGATGDVTVNGVTTSIAELDQKGQLQASSEMPGAKQFPLPTGAVSKVSYKGFTFVVKPVAAGRIVGAGTSIDLKTHIWTGVSIAVHLALILVMYFGAPGGSGLNLDLMTDDNRFARYLSEPPETQEEEQPDWLQPSEEQDPGGKGKRHAGDEGAMGKTEAKKSNNRYGIEGPQDNQDPHMAREAALQQAQTAGILGVLQASSGAWNSPTSPFGRETALGNDPMSALGALMGDQIGENFGFGGLGLRGTGRGGGGTGEGTIGLGNIGTIGHGGGGGDGSGYGSGAGGFRGRSARVPRIRQGNADVHGSLSKEVIRRVVQRHLNEVKFCYEQQLAQRPDLRGRVVASFIIAADGRVQSAAIRESDLGSPPAEACISQAIQRWSFPAPEGGGLVVVNSYPFVLEAPEGGE
ncbi:MAG: AgmX/PglI C-terminal domain-containing protein [Sandaracinaceae bacterium]|nr:AgmX/PglI C-terminal domain-containing protein [Sandaracinaceae bacterium]